MKQLLLSISWLVSSAVVSVMITTTFFSSGVPLSAASAPTVQPGAPPSPITLPAPPAPPAPPQGPPPAPTPAAISPVPAPATPAPVNTLPTAPPTVPLAPPRRPSAQTDQHAHVTVALRADGQAARQGSTLTLTIIATNQGDGDAKDTTISLPINPASASVVSASFSRDTAWVSRDLSSTLVLQTGPLASDGDTVTATVRLAVLDQALPSDAPISRGSYAWTDGSGGGTGRTNRLELSVGGPPLEAPARLVVSQPDSQRPDHVVFASPIFIPGEPVALWYQAPDKPAVEVGRVTADSAGNISVPFELQDLARGSYTMVAFGVWSELTAVYEFNR